MTDAREQALFDEIVRRYGGVDRLSRQHLEIVAGLVAACLALRDAAAGDGPRLAETIDRLTKMLPAPGSVHAPDAPPGTWNPLEAVMPRSKVPDLDLDALSADEQGQLCALLNKAAHRVSPPVDISQALGAPPASGIDAGPTGDWPEPETHHEGSQRPSRANPEPSGQPRSVHDHPGAPLQKAEDWKSMLSVDAVRLGLLIDDIRHLG